MPRCAFCAVCAAPIQLGGGSLPAGQATCRGCRTVDRLPFDKSKCGTPRGRDQHRHRGEPACEPCRTAWNEASRDRQKRARASGWVRPDREAPKVQRTSGQCTKCGKAILAVLADPLCALCRYNRPGYNIRISRADRLAIYERDDWTCGICREPVDQNAPPNSTWDATLDHVVPRSQGGADDLDNLRLAHRWCNSVRGDLSYHADEDLQSA